MSRPRDRTIQYKIEAEYGMDRREFNQFMQQVKRQNLSARLKQSLGLDDPDSLTEDQIEHIKRVLNLERVIQVNNSGGLTKEDIKDAFTTALKEAFPGGIASPVAAAEVMQTVVEKAKRPEMDKVVIDPSENVKIESNIHVKPSQVGGNVSEALEKFRKIKKGEV